MKFHCFEQGRDLLRRLFRRQTGLGEGAGGRRVIRGGILAAKGGRLSGARPHRCERGCEAERQDSHARTWKERSSAAEHSSSPGAYLATPNFFTSIFRALSPRYRNEPTRRNQRGSGQYHLIFCAGTDSDAAERLSCVRHKDPGSDTAGVVGVHLARAACQPLPTGCDCHSRIFARAPDRHPTRGHFAKARNKTLRRIATAWPQGSGWMRLY
jgi:hypothetical protein